jgi:hypothetical protein
MTDKVKLQLGDIIEIVAPTDTDIHEHTYYIVYIDADKILLEEADGNEIILTLTEGNLDNESINVIRLKSRAEENGYARQNNLLPGVWIDVYFGGDLPLTITGKISSLEEDKIEITTYPENEVIFIDFEYKGLPADLPIEKIQIRKAPEVSLADQNLAPIKNLAPVSAKTSAKEKTDLAELEKRRQTLQQELLATEAEEDLSIAELEKKRQTLQQELLETKTEEDLSIAELEKRRRTLQQELFEILDDEEVVDENLEADRQTQLQDQLRTQIFAADQIRFGDDLDAVTQMVDVPEEEQRYDIDKQLDDLLDDMLSTIPNALRTDTTKNYIHTMIRRFKELRDKFSIFDTKGYALMPKAHGTNYKPLVETMEKMEKQLYWILPVTKMVKKIYKDDVNEDGDEDEMVEQGAEDASIINFEEDNNEEKAVVTRYEQNDTANETNKYIFLQKELNPYHTPYLPSEDNAEEVITTKSTNNTITAVVDNFGDIYSSVQGNDTYTSPHRTNKYERKRPQHQKRLATQTYITGTTTLEMLKVRGDNPVIKRKKITADDKIELKSVLTLPEPTVRFARVNLQTASILDKANLNLNFITYWQLLKAKTSVSKATIHDLDEPYHHEAPTFLKSVRNFTVDAAAKEENALTPDAMFHKFLDSVIPKTRFLFELIKPYLTGGKLSVSDILAYLEPFMIYQEDLSFIHQKEMNDYIREKIQDYRKNYISKAREYGNVKGSSNVNLPSFIKILDENPNFRAKVLDVYGFTDAIMQMSNADFLKRIIEIDNGVFYNNVIALLSSNLMIADGSRDMTDIESYLSGKGQMDEDNAGPSTRKVGPSKAGPSKAGPSKTKAQAQGTEAAQTKTAKQSTCNKYKVIAKRYIELDELYEDNGKETYFDKKYDTTAYDIGEKFKVDSNLPLTDQISHYIGKLTKTKNLDETNARRDAEAIIKGKRIVEDGEYAILETTDETSATLQYYVRQNETWVLDEAIDAETFADDMKMFCNLNEKCIEVKNTCQDETTGANEIKKQNLKLLLSEFDTKLNVNREIITNKIETELSRADMRMEKLRNLRLAKLYKYEAAKIALGNSTSEESLKIVVSPYDGLLNTIMGQDDTGKRYLDLSKFVNTFTREGIIDNGESPHWFHCIKTSKRMLPTFLYKLATVFLNGGDYVFALNQICAQQGTLSEDGDKWIDKYSGYTIKMIELNADEEYNEEGFKIVTHAILENEVGIDAALPKGTGMLPQKYATADANKIYNIINTMSSNMGINIEDQKDFIVRNVLKQLTNVSVMPPKAAYEKAYARALAANKPIDTYEKAYNAALVYLTLSYYLIGIQISVPPIKTKITFPGCKKAFSGFPVDADTTDTKGLTYVACVAHKIKNNVNLPWSAIAGRNATQIAKQMEGTITKFILPTEEIQNGIKEAKLYLAANPVQTIPTEHNVESWSNFLPPLKTFKMSAHADVGEVFKTRLVDSLRKGTPAQLDYINEIHSKMLLFSFNIIELIGKTVQGEQGVLRSNNGKPFVENACCDTGDMITLKYFIQKEPEIAILNNKVIRLSDMYDDTKRMTKASLLYDPSNTKRKLREIDMKFSEDTIYRAFIVYCRFNSLTPLNDHLKAICPTKPDNFNADDTLTESIRKLKSSARNYTEQSLQQLLDVVNQQTQTPIVTPELRVTNADKLTEIMLKMDEENARPSTFRTAFMAILENFEINALLQDNTQLRQFKNLLAKLNEDMQRQIIAFVADTRSSLKSTTLKEIKETIETILEFKETTTRDATGYKMVNFMKKTMRSLTKEFPNIILNNVNYTDKVTVPSHWKLSLKHQMDMKNVLADHYEELNKYYQDTQVQLLMKKLTASVNDLNALAQNTLFYTPVEIKAVKKPVEGEEGSPSKEGSAEYKYSAFDLDLTTYLFKFYFFSVLTDLIAFQQDPELLQLPLTELEEASTTEDEERFMRKANEMDVLVGNQAELGEKIMNVLVSFVTIIGNDKRAINYNYKSLMDLILRSKEKEKDDITDYLQNINDEESALDKLYKVHKLGRWSKGEQKGFHSYEGATYDEEREEMEQMAIRETKLNKRSVVTDMNRDIYRLDMLSEDADLLETEKEDNNITYLGEDGEPEDFGMDGDENDYEMNIGENDY